MTNNIPKLCGGTFLTLLLQAVKPHNRSHVTIKGEKVRLSNTNVLRALIQVFDPTSYLPDDKSFNTMTSKYKNCNKIGDANFRYDDSTVISAFNQEVLENYNSPLVRMTEFAETYLNIETPAKYAWLVRAILELLSEDTTITDDAFFYIGDNRSASTKKQLISTSDISLEPFLLGVWHFIIMNRPDNIVGKSTVARWHAAPSNPNAQRDFTSEIGKGYRCDLNVSRLTEIPDLEDNIEQPEVEIIEPEIINRKHESKDGANPSNNQSQNQPVNIFNQFGNGNTQIGSVGTFINK
ncbi:hypothetical protein SAMN02745116_01908 [Pilibacter termitis]|uniref:Uncharacterized protein n=1 Tax=Pilibacter termitis TaxID=263852 RepID=A0A1T4PRV3_9ENTE|nr:hypothetical protein [Pilibacter termitis]SJZ94292.1 hypothetical protein SAMN02745116_01908 [Pilibacter termitis]